MKTYRFETEATMKAYNRRKWRIDADIVRPIEVEAENLKNALEDWRDKVQERHHIKISNNALKAKSPAARYGRKYGNHPQIGYVITGKAEFDKTSQYIDLWVTITEVIPSELWEW